MSVPVFLPAFSTPQGTNNFHDRDTPVDLGCSPVGPFYRSKVETSSQVQTHQFPRAPGSQIHDSFIQSHHTGLPCVNLNGQYDSSVLYQLAEWHSIQETVYNVKPVGTVSFPGGSRLNLQYPRSSEQPSRLPVQGGGAPHHEWELNLMYLEPFFQMWGTPQRDVCET